MKDVNSAYKPIPGLLPEGWKLSKDKPISIGYRYGELNYSKIRGRKVKEEVSIRYSILTKEEKGINRSVCNRIFIRLVLMSGKDGWIHKG